MGEKRADMLRVEFFGMSLLMEKNIPLNPISVSLFRPETEVFEPRDIAYLIEQFSLRHATDNTAVGGLSLAYFYDGKVFVLVNNVTERWKFWGMFCGRTIDARLRDREYYVSSHNSR
jgi:hypothetical protein